MCFAGHFDSHLAIILSVILAFEMEIQKLLIDGRRGIGRHRGSFQNFPILHVQAFAY